MGQVQVSSVRTEAVDEVLAALGEAGLDVTPVTVPQLNYGREMRCRAGSHELVICICDSSDPTEAHIVMAHPPYSLWPWRWIGDFRLFNKATLVLDEFAYRD